VLVYRDDETAAEARLPELRRDLAGIEAEVAERRRTVAGLVVRRNLVRLVLLGLVVGLPVAGWTLGQWLAPAAQTIVVYANAGAAADIPETRCRLAEGAACATLGDAATDAGQAYLLYRRACLAGHSAACPKVARALYSGQGVAVDKPTALRLLVEACLGGDADACVWARGPAALGR
jgi:hypothetical protein